LKTHKTGSSTITSILNRYADLNDLQMALPKGQRNRFMWPGRFSPRSVAMKHLGKEGKVNILANHARLIEDYQI